MSELKPLEEIRLRNLLELQGRFNGIGSPTAKNFAEILSERGCTTSGTKLTSIYQREKPITSEYAFKIERALNLPQGWLNESHDFIFSLSPDDIDAHKAFSQLPAEVKNNISSLIISLSKLKTN